MSDVIDRANDTVLFSQDVAIRNYLETHQAEDKSGSEGICNDCGNDIAPERVAALPHCLRCIECQQAHEKREKL